MIGFINGLIVLFQSVLLLSFGASIVLGLILLSKTLFGRRMSSRSHARIWLVLILFLLLPLPQLLGSITIPEGALMDFWAPMNRTVQMLYVEPISNPASVYQSDSTSSANVSLNNASGTASYVSTGSAAGDASASVSGGQSSSSADQGAVQPTNDNRPIGGILSIKLSTAQKFWLIASSIWLAGLLLLLGIFIFGYSRTILTLRKKGLPVPAAWSSHFGQMIQSMNCRQPVKLYLLAEASGPFIIGVFNRRIVLPSDLLEQLEPDEIDAILTHELVHYRHHDPLLRLLLCCLQSVQWFNPLCWIAIRLIQRDCEYYCDDTTIRILGERGSRTQYARTLLATVTCCAGNQPDSRMEIPGSILMASFIEINLKDRIHRVLRERKTSALVTSIAVLSVMLAGCALLPGFLKTTPSIEPTPTVTIAPTSSGTSLSNDSQNDESQPATPSLSPLPATKEQLAAQSVLLEEMIKRSDTQALIPYISNGLITDLQVLTHKAEIIIDIYNRFIAPTGENHLEPYISPYDTSGIYTAIAWTGDIDESDLSGSSFRMFSANFTSSQLKIKLRGCPLDYLPVPQVENNGITLKTGTIHEQADLQTFFQGLTYVRGESHKLEIDEGQPMQKHNFGLNLVDMLGDSSQLENGFSGYITSLKLLEGDFILDKEIQLGDPIDGLLAKWPILEDFCEKTSIYNQRINVFELDTFVLTFTDNKLSQIDIREFMD
ncbi:MAG: M56 family metallopeptidase [Saccharofermentanales bacterium]